MLTAVADHLAILAQRSLPDQTGNVSPNIPGEVAVGLQDATISVVPVFINCSLNAYAAQLLSSCCRLLATSNLLQILSKF